MNRSKTSRFDVESKFKRFSGNHANRKQIFVLLLETLTNPIIFVQR